MPTTAGIHQGATFPHNVSPSGMFWDTYLIALFEVMQVLDDNVSVRQGLDIQHPNNDLTRGTGSRAMKRSQSVELTKQ